MVNFSLKYKIFYLEYTSMTKLSSSLNYPIHMRTGGYILQNKYGFRLERYSHILIWCGRIFIKDCTCNRKCRKECSFTKLVYPFNNEMIWFVILMHQKPFLSLKTSLFQVYGNIEIVEGYSSQIYTGGKQFNLLEEYSPLSWGRHKHSGWLSEFC